VTKQSFLGLKRLLRFARNDTLCSPVKTGFCETFPEVKLLRKSRGLANNSAQAIVVVITFIAMLSIIGVAFFSLGQVERNAGIRNLDALRARYLAEAGVTYAHNILSIDAANNTIDSLDDLTYKQFLGNDTDLDLDNIPEARWINVTDADGSEHGRFAARVSDESSKININICGRETIEGVLSQAGAGTGSAARIIEERPLNAVEQAGPLIGKSNFLKVKNFLTIYSKDPETDLSKKRRIYINSASFQSILEAIIACGLSYPHQKAANLKDAADADLAQTLLNKFSLSRLYPASMVDSGGWQRSGDSYVANSGGEAGKFIWSNLQVADGEYYCFFYAPKDTDTVGEAYMEENPELKELLLCGEGLTQKVKVSSKSLSLSIKPVSGKICRFSYIELVGLEPQEGLQAKEIYGSEALLINELMVKLTREIELPEAIQITPGQSFKYVFNGIKEGYYYISLKAGTEGGAIGDVTVNSRFAAGLYGGDYFPEVIKVDESTELSVFIKNNTLGPASFKGIKISQEPDAEYIEILNLSPEAIDLTNFSVEVQNLTEMMVSGWPARIPEGTSIQPYQHLVLAVDANNAEPAPVKLRNNNLYFGSVFKANAVGLDFEEYTDTIDKTFDLLPNKGGYVILKDAVGRLVDKVQYKLNQVKEFSCLERGDPTYHSDGVFYEWQTPDSEDKATPSINNDNSGMYTYDEFNIPTKHTPGEKVVFNRALVDFSEVLKISSGQSWKNFTVSDLSRMQDHFSFQKITLALAGHYKNGDFREISSLFESAHNGDSGTWEFSDIPSGNYLLSIISNDINTESVKVKAAYKTKAEGFFESYSELMFAQGVAFFGRVELPGEGEDKSFFALQLVNDSDDKKISVKEIRLEPVFSTAGKVNVNTAPAEVLRAAIGSEDLVQKILSNRPIGLKSGVKLGIGELFVLDTGFIPYNDALTVRSDIYEINAYGEYLKNKKSAAFQTVRTVLERIE